MGKVIYENVEGALVRKKPIAAIILQPQKGINSINPTEASGAEAVSAPVTMNMLPIAKEKSELPVNCLALICETTQRVCITPKNKYLTILTKGRHVSVEDG